MILRTCSKSYLSLEEIVEVLGMAQMQVTLLGGRAWSGAPETKLIFKDYLVDKPAFI